uniref:G-protein coupled receptors family 1 profile domain-containing protein n=1 Tax=Leptobrachium leishanense TaxID=445787 RepID=A0A8C5LPR0_9ANUR
MSLYFVAISTMNITCCAFEEPILDEVLPPILLLVFILGLVGNSLGLWMMFLEFKSWKPNSIYLFSLTIADFVVLFCVLFRADYYIRGKDWVYGDALCRLLLFTLTACRCAGVIFLMIIAIDRYIRILLPFHRLNNITLKEAAVICCLLWMSIFALSAYLLTDPHFFHVNNSTQCESFNICPKVFSSAAWHDVFFILMSITSLCVISYCTVSIILHLKNNTIDTNGKVMRAVKFVLSIAVVFSICYLPSTMVRVAIWILKFQKKEQCVHYRESNLTFYVTICFTYFYSMLNPILYYFSSTSFSGLFQKIGDSRLIGRGTWRQISGSVWEGRFLLDASKFRCVSLVEARKKVLYRWYITPPLPPCSPPLPPCSPPLPPCSPPLPPCSPLLLFPLQPF